MNWYVLNIFSLNQPYVKHNSSTILFAFSGSIEHSIFHLPFMCACIVKKDWATWNDANYFENLNNVGDL